MSHPTWVRGLKFRNEIIEVGDEKSHPTWVRGLKSRVYFRWFGDKVAPHVGAWIEISCSKKQCTLPPVAPHVGAWIEISGYLVSYRYNRVAPHVGAWIEISYEDLHGDCPESHPTWVRGLKYYRLSSCRQCSTSHPTWVRGLK